ncbi:8-amino-7-oxononanoate synthase [Flavihumibacter sp. R14]|nr:8-amino-7-oxononanoate synthase [Flavihumibacter soli]
MNQSINRYLEEVLDRRKEQSLYRYLQVNDNLVDFCSNDYLSFARSSVIREAISQASKADQLTGSTGSRSISGNTTYAEELESMLAGFHNAEAGLLFNSGYDANVGLFSCIARKEDTLVSDELIHASIIDGSRLSYAGRLRFAHNDAGDLEKKLQHVRSRSTNQAGNIFVAVESVYSMDGDIASLKEIAAVCKKYDASLIVDEAHATGVFGAQGRGLVDHFGLEDEVFARVHTFGKAIGAHGAIVLGSEALRNYLINFARSFIFTTALPVHSLIAIRCAYEQLMSDSFTTDYIHKLIAYFKRDFQTSGDVFLIESTSPIQSLVIPGNQRARDISRQLQSRGFDVRAILSPSVPVGKERLRISLHMHNTMDQVGELKQALNELLFA